jgi:NAD(P)-dependent dehydrogenase (short-subunit alcohol dehydrogenase family)
LWLHAAMSIAIVTGASRGLGRALARGLARRGWSLVLDARNGQALDVVHQEIWGLLPPGAHVVAVPGDVTDAEHRKALAGAAYALGGLDLLVSNAGILGPSPLPKLVDLPLAALRELFEVYPIAGLSLVQETIGMLRAATDGGRVALITSDAAVEAYPGWGGYGSAKAASDQLAAVLAAEEPELRVWAVDPGDLRTDMHQAAYPGEDISDRADPEAVAPSLVDLFESRRASGRVRASELSEGSGR